MVMITINLLSKELRKTERKVVLPYKNYIILLAGVFILLHGVLFSVAALKKIQIVIMKARISRVSPESKEAVQVKKEVVKLDAQAAVLKKILSHKVVFTEFLSNLTMAVPKGLWLDRFSFTPDGMVIQGSVISFDQNEMTIIGRFLQDLKDDKNNAAFFSKIELNSVQRRMIKTYDVVDFVLVGEFKK